MAEQAHPTLGRSNPAELGSETVSLYPCEGRVHRVLDFAMQKLEALAPHERALVTEQQTSFAPAAAIPPELSEPLCRSPEFAISARPALVANRSGARSAYWRATAIKLKGCRPVTDGSTYPVERLPWGAPCIQREVIPFGVMTAEGVMRELLAYCFQCQHGITPHAVPLCIFEYVSGGTAGFCLVLRSRGETRVEEFIDYPIARIEDIVIASRTGQGLAGYAWGSELPLKGLNLCSFVEQKSELLCAFHSHGGFRGILNSNIGNDVLPGPNAPLCLCDFDTFKAVALPERPTAAFVRAFLLQCLVEVVKGSLSILDYVELPEDLDAASAGQRLAGLYFARSSVWRAYERKLMACLQSRGWEGSLLREGLEEATRTQAFLTVVGQCVPNSRHLREDLPERGVYYPHN